MNYLGFTSYSNQYGKYYNVHAKNVSITIPSTRTSNSIYAGALVGNAYYAKFTNCSVTNVKIVLTSMISDIRIGGMVGYSNGSSFNNVFAQDVDISVTNTISTNGVGGLVGQEAASVATIRDAYTTGKIYSNGRHTGGITGVTSGFVENTYSMVNIVAELRDIGGITGDGTTNNINNNLFIGNLSTKLKDANMYRIIGNNLSNDTNYALDSLLMNGFPSDVVNGETLISMGDLLKPGSYNNDNGLQLGSAFDYSQVSKGIIPKLYYMDTQDLLPNQKDVYFLKDLFEVDDIVIDKHAEYSDIVFYLKNPNQYIIDDIVIDDMETTITQNSYAEGISIVKVHAIPTKYYDSYYAKEIKYHINNETEILSCEKMLFLEMIFYKNLRTFDDWQSVSKADAENYLLLNDIDFTGLNYNRDVIFNRLETVSDSEMHTLKGMKITQTTNKHEINIIKKVMTSIKNIKFEDIDIEYLQTSNSDYVNIIDYNYGEIHNLAFENVKINAPTKNRVGMIGRAYTQVIDNVTLKDITLIGKSYVGGLLAYYENNKNFILSNISGENINVTGSANYIGGLFTNFNTGSGDNINNIYNISIKDSTISGPNSSYVGGIGAYAGATDNVMIDNVHVIGREYVGGAFGYANGYTTNNLTVKNSNIEGSYRYIGGVAGQYRNYLYDSIVYDTTVTGTSVDTYAVGGFFGYHSYYTMSRNSIRDSVINNNGTMTGGFVGLMAAGTISVSSIDNVIVNGVNYVGGFAGDLQGGTLINSKVTNSTINAQEKYAGGLVGRHDNSVTGSTFYEGAIRLCMVLNSNITSNSNAGGFIGAKNEPLYYPYNNYGLYLDSSVSTNDNETAYIGTGDSSNEEFSNLIRMGFYQNSLVNNVPIKNYVSSTAQNTNLIGNITTGFINESTGVHEMNYNYPYASYTDLILLKAGKTYLLTAFNKSKSTSDVFRVRFYDTNENYIGNVNNSSNTWNYLGNYYYLSNLREITFTPVRDVKISVQYLYEIEETSLVEIKSTYVNMLQNRLFNETQLRNRILWNRYMSDDLQDFYYVTYYGYDASIWDFSVLNSEKTNITVLDKTRNQLNAKANFTSITDDGLFVGGVRDEIKIDNFEPNNNITISTRFISYSGRSYQYLFSYRDPSVSSGVGLFLHGRTIYGMINGSMYNTSYTIPLYKEVSVSMTYDNNTALRIYINGELIYSNLNIRKEIKKTNNAQTYIAHDASYADSYNFLGIIKRVDVYDRALSDTEINANYYHSYGVSDSTGLMLSYDFTSIEYDDIGYYPSLKNLEEQAMIPLPVKSNNSTLNTLSSPLNSPKSLTRSPIFDEKIDGNYHIYSSSIDTINLEFDKISNDLSFTCKIGETEETIKVDRRVYTIHYDYNSDIEIILKNAFEEKKIDITRESLRKTISIYNGNYYYIKDNKLYNRDTMVLDNALHVYKNLVLLEDHRIYNLETDNIQTPIDSNSLIVNTIPIYHFSINSTMVSTYYNFTEIVNSDGEKTIKDNQIIYKNGYLYNVDLIDKDNSSIIVNNYIGNEYQIALGMDGELYSYKKSLDLNSAFINANIKEINSDFSSELPIIMIRYRNDEILVLNYYNGEKIYDTGDKQNISLIDYISTVISNNDLSANNSSYSDNNELKNNLDVITDKDISKLLSNPKTNNNPKTTSTDPVSEDAIVTNNTVNNKYIVSYNENSNEYEVYDVDDILFGDMNVTINSKINSNKTLYNYFYSTTKINEILKDNRLIIYIAIISLIIVNLIYLIVKSRRKEVVNE